MESSAILKYNIEQEFISNFGAPEVLLFAPGRANIIGEHTDYNEGFVLPFAIGQGIYFYASKVKNSTVKIIAADIQESSTFDLKEDHVAKYGWEKFVFQVIEALGRENIAGFNLVFGGDLPIGGGISSSSALTCGLVSLMNDLFDLGFTKDDIVWKSVEAERGYGVRGGIMDQFTIVNAIKDCAILLDCKDNSYLQIPLHLSNHSFYLFNTNVKHNLLHTDYNNRRAECETAVEIIAKSYRPISSLRDLYISDIDQIKDILNDRLFRRVSFVIKENQRVIDAKQALLDNDLVPIGKLLSASHEGLSQDY
ncbi:MAG TPA: galactokinase family protein, partial [Saprospiraceae bacterium]|nr:galactokinase family protein [Saprospiraceae bacterium]